MVIQGLSPAKKQGYFIVYGNQLQFMRSYFGTMAVTKRLEAVQDVVAQVVYEGDTFEYAIENGRKKIIKHESRIENVDLNKIAGAYCLIILKDGNCHTEIMNMAQIKISWSKSKMKENRVQQEFADQMAMRTVINRACKYYANTSDDSDLLIESFNRTTQAEYEEEDIAPEIAEKANKQVIDYLNAG